MNPNNTASSKEQGGVANANWRIEDAKETLLKELSRLEDAIRPILKQETPQVLGQNPQENIVNNISDHTRTLLNHVDTMNMIIVRIGAIIKRVDL
jgi:hypothetical protein